MIASVITNFLPSLADHQEGEEPAGTSKRLVERISQLHKEAIAMHTRWEEVCEKLNVIKAEKLRLEDELIMAKDVPVKVNYMGGGERWNWC